MNELTAGKIIEKEALAWGVYTIYFGNFKTLTPPPSYPLENFHGSNT